MTLTKHTTVAAINIAFSRIHKKRNPPKKGVGFLFASYLVYQ